MAPPQNETNEGEDGVVLLEEQTVVQVTPERNGEAVNSPECCSKTEGTGDTLQPLLEMTTPDTMEKNSPPNPDNLQVKSGKVKHPTSFLETLIHLLKGNIGSGMFAMGDAFKHAGIVAGPVLTLFLGVICIYNNHVLVNCSNRMKERKKMECNPNFPQTVEFCFESGPQCFRRWTHLVRRTVKIFVIVTQLGFCCVYFVFVSSTLQHVLKPYGYAWDVRIYMLIMLIPVLTSCLIRSLKFLAPISLLSNIFVGSSVLLTLYLCSSNLPPISSRPYVAKLDHLPLFFGTTIYSFEGISLILPLQNEMRNQALFSKPYGVLNIGLSIVTALLIAVGFIGFLQFGDDVKGSLSLNLPDDVFSHCVQLVLAVGIVFSYALQFYVAADLIWDDVSNKWGPFKRPVLREMALRTVLVIFTMCLAAVIPRLGLFISLIGAVSSTALALLYPAMCDIAVRCCPPEDGPLRSKDHYFRLSLDGLTLIIAFIGFVTGTVCSLQDIIVAFIN